MIVGLLIGWGLGVLTVLGVGFVMGIRARRQEAREAGPEIVRDRGLRIVP